MDQRVEFGILGPLQVLRDGAEVPVRRRKQRVLLTLLLLHANEVVSRDRLIDALWDDEAPRTADSALQGSVSQLRKLIGAERLVTKAPGYLLRATTEELDLARVERLVAEGRAATEPAGRAERLRAALALWRGQPLAEFENDAFARAELDRLVELRLGALEERIDADLELGRDRELVAELETLVAAHPYRERLRGQLMLALYRCGRQAEALSTYRTGRQLLVDELGIDPSSDLQHLERQILAQDASLEPARPARPTPASTSPSSGGADAPGLVRKTVTVLFCDVVGSTPLGERLDPEVLRRLMSRYFDAASAALERHGGTVEKFIGDAVMAVFGLPALHEDDAVRAVRAAVELRATLVTLDDEFERDYGARIGIRIGINTGEVVAGEGQTLVTGDVVNVAARLEQSAAPGEIVLGGATHRLVRDVVLAEAVEPMELKGKSGSFDAFRLVDLLPDIQAARGLGAAFVGRVRELELLREAYARALDGRGCEAAVVTGPAGIGKSRLVHEFVAEIDAEALVLSGRCLSYGNGITYWPLREAVQQLAGDDPRGRLTSLLAEDVGAADAIGAAVGFGGRTPQSSEVSWAARRLLEKAGAERTVVLVLDDLHWAEPAFLDLVDYVRTFLRGVGVLIVGTGRPELLDLRPSWREFAFPLEPLAAAEAEELAECLSADDDFARASAVEIAEGNPLFLEQLVAAGKDEGMTVPPTIQALLASRVDRLAPAERTVAVIAAIEGRQFHRGAVMSLAPVELSADVTSYLLALVRKDILRPDESLFPGEDGFRFVHALVREAAYAAASKELRAHLHERYAGWLEGVAGERAGEFEEILGYHFGEAYRLRSELGPLDAHARELGARAASLLGDAGRRALGRSDFNAAQSLLERAVASASGDDAERTRYECDLAETLLFTGDAPRALELTHAARAAAQARGDDAANAQADVLHMSVILLGGQTTTTVEAREVAERALEVLASLGDDRSLARAWGLLGTAWGIDGQTERHGEAVREALRYARRADDGRLESECILWLAAGWALGPTPVDEAIARCEDLRADVGTRLRESFVDLGYALVLALAGRLDEARIRIGEARGFIHDLGDELTYAGTGWMPGLFELWAGDLVAADAFLSEACVMLRAIGNRGFLCTTAAYLAEVRCRQGRLDEAEELARESEDAGIPDDLVNEIYWRIARAHVLALRGQHQAAEKLAREAIAAASATDQLAQQGDAALALAEVLRVSGRDDDARAAATDAARLFRSKGATLRLAAAQALLGEQALA